MTDQSALSGSSTMIKRYTNLNYYYLFIIYSVTKKFRILNLPTLSAYTGG